MPDKGLTDPPVLIQRLICGSGLVLALLGIAMVFAACGTDQLLLDVDPILGLKNRTLLLIGGPLHIGVGAYVAVSRNTASRVLVALWVGWDCVVYYLGVILMKGSRPLPPVQLVGWSIGFRDPSIVNDAWQAFVAFLVAGGFAFLALDWRRVHQAERLVFLRRWSERRQAERGMVGGPVHTRVQGSAGATTPPPEFKFGCPNCGQHIRCGPAYSGRRIDCPGCGSKITVPPPTAGPVDGASPQ